MRYFILRSLRKGGMLRAWLPGNEHAHYYLGGLGWMGTCYFYSRVRLYIFCYLTVRNSLPFLSFIICKLKIDIQPLESFQISLAPYSTLILPHLPQLGKQWIWKVRIILRKHIPPSILPHRNNILHFYQYWWKTFAFSFIR